MSLAVVAALSLCGQITPHGDDTLNQWESRLLESKWVLTDPRSGTPQMVLVLKDFTPSHRIFQLTMYNAPTGDGTPWVQTWTGTYKMESRRANNKEFEAQDAVKLVRLHADQYWIPVDRDRPDRVKNSLMARGLLNWTDEIAYIDWLERKDFKPFFAELIVDAPFMWAEPPIPTEHARFFLRSDEVTKIGWWKNRSGAGADPDPKTVNQARPLGAVNLSALSCFLLRTAPKERPPAKPRSKGRWAWWEQSHCHCCHQWRQRLGLRRSAPGRWNCGARSIPRSTR